MPDAVVNGVRLVYEVQGKGEPLLLVCGLGQPAISWSFGIVPRLLDAGFQVVTFDNRGMPPSDAPAAPYSIAAMTADAIGLVEQLGLAPCRVAGYSLGSWITETMAATRADLVRSVALIGGLNRSTEWERASCEYGRDLARVTEEVPRLQAAMEMLQYLPRRAIQDDDVVDTFVSLGTDSPPWPNPGRLGQWEAAVGWTTDTERTRLWRTIRAPALVLAFEHDIDSPPARAREAAAELANATFVELPGLGHLAPLEDPDRVAAVLVEFFRADGPGV